MVGFVLVPAFERRLVAKRCYGPHVTIRLCKKSFIRQLYEHQDVSNHLNGGHGWGRCRNTIFVLILLDTDRRQTSPKLCTGHGLPNSLTQLQHATASGIASRTISGIMLFPFMECELSFSSCQHRRTRNHLGQSRRTERPLPFHARHCCSVNFRPPLSYIVLSVVHTLRTNRPGLERFERGGKLRRCDMRTAGCC